MCASRVPRSLLGCARPHAATPHLALTEVQEDIIALHSRVAVVARSSWSSDCRVTRVRASRVLTYLSFVGRALQYR